MKACGKTCAGTAPNVLTESKMYNNDYYVGSQSRWVILL